jgi:aminoacylase
VFVVCVLLCFSCFCVCLWHCFCFPSLKFRAEQEKILLEAESKSCSHARKTLGDVTTVNLTFLQGGVTQDGGKTFAINVIPQEARAGFDIRIPPHVSLAEFQKQLNEWTSEEGVSYERLSVGDTQLD